MVAAPHSRPFGSLPTGEEVEAWTLTGQGGLILRALTYGGTVNQILAPDRGGQLADVVLGFKDLPGYLNGGAYFGAITGRVAGRITAGKFRLAGQTISLTRNAGPNHLHGGVSGFDKKNWSATVVSRPDHAPSLRFFYSSADGEEGYPGKVDVSVTYTIAHDNTFLIETEAVADKPTPVNLTHHSYFNLAGEGSGSVADHSLWIDANESVPTDNHMTLLGRLQSVDGQPNDFRHGRLLGNAIPLLFQEHGDLYRLCKPSPIGDSSGPTHAACLRHQPSGRVLNVFTTNEYLQLYTAASLNGMLTGKSGVPYGRHAGLCLECEGYPDGVNHPALGDNLLSPGQPQRHTTAYAFSIDTATTRP